MSLPFTSIISGGLALGGDGSIKPVSILDCADAVGTAGQVLSSTGTALEWIAAGGSAATPTVAGLVLGCTSIADSAALGCNALVSLTTGTENVALGPESLRSITTGCTNVAVGTYALCCSETAEANVALGYAAGYGATGSFNTLIGAGAGELLTTGECNVALGYYVQLPDPAGSCQLAIGHDPGVNWLTGDSTLAIKPGAGIIDCASSCGTAGQVLQSTGANSIVWATPASGYAGYNGYKTSVTNGTKFNVTGWPREVGRFWMGQLNIFTSYGTDPTYVNGSNVLIMVSGYNGLGTSTIQTFNTSSGTFGLEANSYPAYTDTTVVFTPSLDADRMNFFIRYLDASGEGGPGNSDGNPFASYLTIF